MKRLYEKGKIKEAMKFASDLDTAVREEIPLKIWKEMGGELTASGEKELKAQKMKEQKSLEQFTQIYKYTSENPQVIKQGAIVWDENNEERIIAEASDKMLRLEGDQDWKRIDSVKFRKEKNFDNRPDNLNPKFIFSLTTTQLLTEALKGEFELDLPCQERTCEQRGGFKRKLDWV